MTAADLLATARALGATFTLDGDAFVVRKGGNIPAEIRVELTAHKAEITAMLQREAAPSNNIDVGPTVAGGAPLGIRVGRVTSQAALATLAEAVGRSDVEIALDLTTSGPDPLLHRPVILAVVLANGTHVVDLDATSGLGPFGDALRRVKVVGYDLQRQLAFLQRHYEVMPAVMADALVQSKLLGGGADLDAQVHGLDALVGVWLNITLPAAPSQAEIAARAPGVVETLAVRAGVLPSLMRVLGDAVVAAGLKGAADLERLILPSVVETSLHGVRVDTARLTALLAEREAEMTRHGETLTGALGEVNLDDNQAVLEALQRYGLAVDKTGKGPLAPFLSDPVVQALVTRRRLQAFARDLAPKTLANASQYLDGRVRPEINPLGAPTGRFSYKRPNLQGTEKSDAVRACFIPADGCVFVVGDYSNIDLRVLADHTRDPALIAAFKAGEDLHRKTAARHARKAPAEVTDVERNGAKVINFGPVYGMGAEKLALRIFETTKRVVSIEEAQRMLTEYRQAYPMVAGWQDRTHEDCARELRTGSGRIRRFGPDPKLYPQRLNTPIQGTAADGLKLALIGLSGVLPKFGARVVITVHDEIVVEVPREHAEAVVANLRGHMVAGMSFFVKRVPIVVEVDVRTTWAKGSNITAGGGR